MTDELWRAVRLSGAAAVLLAVSACFGAFFARKLRRYRGTADAKTILRPAGMLTGGFLLAGVVLTFVAAFLYGSWARRDKQAVRPTMPKPQVRAVE